MGYLNKNHLSLVTAPAVREICQPLFVYTPIRHMSFIRRYTDGSYIILMSFPEWHQHFWEMDYSFELFSSYSTESGYVVLEPRSLLCLQDAEDHFHISSPVYLLSECKDYVEEFHFFTTPDLQFSFYKFIITNPHIIKNFKFYFKERASKLIKLFDSHNLLNSGVLSTSHDNFHPAAYGFNPKKYELNIDGETVYLTKKELEIIRFLTQNNSAKQIAAKQKISVRTVEERITNLKLKFNCNYKTEIIDKLSTSPDINDLLGIFNCIK